MQWKNRSYPTRFVGDRSTRLVHDLQNEHHACHVGEIVDNHYDVAFPTLVVGTTQGYLPCRKCNNV